MENQTYASNIRRSNSAYLGNVQKTINSKSASINRPHSAQAGVQTNSSLNTTSQSIKNFSTIELREKLNNIVGKLAEQVENLLKNISNLNSKIDATSKSVCTNDENEYAETPVVDGKQDSSSATPTNDKANEQRVSLNKEIEEFEHKAELESLNQKLKNAKEQLARMKSHAKQESEQIAIQAFLAQAKRQIELFQLVSSIADQISAYFKQSVMQR